MLPLLLLTLTAFTALADPKPKAKPQDPGADYYYSEYGEEYYNYENGDYNYEEAYNYEDANEGQCTVEKANNEEAS